MATTVAPNTSQAVLRMENGLVTRVDVRGLEPLTPTLPVWCATSCATAPCRPGLVCPSRRQPYRPGDRVPAGGPSPRATGRRRRRPPARARTATPERGPSGSGRRSRGHLRDPDVVTERVTEAEVDPVGLHDRLLGQVHATLLQLGVGLVGVIGLEEQMAAGGTLGDEITHLVGDVVTQPGRPRTLQQHRVGRVAGQGDGQEAHGAELLVDLDLE